MNILHVVTAFGIGGAEEVAFQLATAQAKNHDVHVLTVRGHPFDADSISRSNVDRLRKSGCTLQHGVGGSSLLGLISAALKLSSLQREIGFDIVHSHTDIPDMCCSLALRLTRFPLVRTIHNTKLWPTRRISAFFCERPFIDDMVVAIGQDTNLAYEMLRSELGLSSSRFRAIIPNEVRLDQPISPEGAQIINGLAGSSRLKLLFIGRLEEQKGFDLLVSAISVLPPSLKDKVELHVIGEGTLRAHAESKKLNLPVHLYGAVANAAALISSFDLLVVPSRFEGFPLVPLEGKLQGVPVIVTDGPGIREVYPAPWPLVCEAGSLKSLIGILEAAISDIGYFRELASKEMHAHLAGGSRMIEAYCETYRSYRAAKK